MVWTVVLLLAASLACVAVAVRNTKSEETLEDRLGEAEASATAQAGLPKTASIPASLMPLAALGEKLAGGEKSVAVTARLCAQAGFSKEGAAGLFLFVKTVLGVGAALVVILLSRGFDMGTLAGALIAYFAAGTAPEWLLKSAAERRRVKIERAMPDALDLMVICAEAGLPFTRILKVVARELALSAPSLARELAVTSAELEILPDRATALKNLATRTAVQSVESMVSTLVQAEQFGTPLAQALANIAEESRTTLILTLEERAGKLPARLSIPLMTLILPPVVALVAAPALMRVIRSLMA